MARSCLVRGPQAAARDTPTEYENKLRDLLDQAIGLTASRWRPFLEKACDDPAMAREAEALLRAESGLGGFLETPLANPNPSAGAGAPTDAERLGEAAAKRRALGAPEALGLADSLMELTQLEESGAARTALLAEALEIRRRILPEAIDT